MSKKVQTMIERGDVKNRLSLWRNVLLWLNVFSYVVVLFSSMWLFIGSYNGIVVHTVLTLTTALIIITINEVILKKLVRQEIIRLKERLDCLEEDLKYWKWYEDQSFED